MATPLLYRRPSRGHANGEVGTHALRAVATKSAILSNGMLLGDAVDTEALHVVLDVVQGKARADVSVRLLPVDFAIERLDAACLGIEPLVVAHHHRVVIPIGSHRATRAARSGTR